MGLLVASLVLLAASASHVDTIADTSPARTKYAIAVGALGFVLSLLMLGLTTLLRPSFNLAGYVVFSLLYVIAVGLVTTGEGVAAITINNIYFSCWIGSALSLSLLYDSVLGSSSEENDDVDDDEDVENVDKEGGEWVDDGNQSNSTTDNSDKSFGADSDEKSANRVSDEKSANRDSDEIDV